MSSVPSNVLLRGDHSRIINELAGKIIIIDLPGKVFIELAGFCIFIELAGKINYGMKGKKISGEIINEVAGKSTYLLTWPG